jgi:lipopolysaccharide transport system ATP-binding protein
MSDIVIKAEGLGKKYLIGHQSERERYTALRDVLARNVKSVLHKTHQLFSGQQLLAGDEVEEFWALRDIDFEIKRGDRVGIIGRNGAGKSTLLKILSRITEPSTGRVEIRGRVASLLEVGTGFHPELTGRENIYLNGAILGMTRAEIKKKFDEIVDFAGVEKFLDTPVKRYSSGMYVRLAFAVAAHLEPEILVVDEVLAVGDAEFQKKCIGKMEDVSKNEGRTVLFVSHNMSGIQALCNTSIWVDQGRIKQQGVVNEVIHDYQKKGFNVGQEKKWPNDKAPGSEVVKLYRIAIVNKKIIPQNVFDIIDEVGVLFEYDVLEDGKVIWGGFNLFNADGINIFDSHSVTIEYYRVPHLKGLHQIVAWIPSNLLGDGLYYIGVALFNHLAGVIHCHLKDVLSFSIIDKGGYGEITAKGDMGTEFPGIIRPLLTWEKIN